LLGAGVLYVIFVHPYRWLAGLIKPWWHSSSSRFRSPGWSD
jgi:hypothetical protein